MRRRKREGGVDDGEEKGGETESEAGEGEEAKWGY